MGDRADSDDNVSNSSSSSDEMEMAAAHLAATNASGPSAQPRRASVVAPLLGGAYTAQPVSFARRARAYTE